MTRVECLQKIRHIQRSMYTFVWEDRKIHQFKADDADKFYYYLDMIAKYLEEDVPKEKKPKTGHWKPFDLTFGRSIYYCTSCEHSTNMETVFKYCPNCGARMEGGAE